MPQSASPLPSVTVYSFGTPLETGAFAAKPSAWNWRTKELPQWCNVEDHPSGPEAATVSVTLGRSDAVVGLGLHVGPLNCRGNVFRLFASDNPVHTPAARSLYGAHSFHVILREKPVGIFVDSAGEIVVDAGCSNRDELAIKVQEPGWRLALIEGATPTEIIESYLALVGAPYIPPRWAFGFHQSRWSYQDEGTVRDIAAQARHNGVPLSVIHLDIDYMDGYRVFTVDKSRFPDLSRLAADLREDGIRLISILDPGVKAELGFPLFEEGAKRGFFCTTADGEEPFVGAVWPGPSVFPDFFRKEVRSWWGSQYLKLKALGIAGFWNDMNEPSVFYTPAAVQDFATALKALADRGDCSEELSNRIFSPSLGQRRSYFDEFFHETELGRRPNRAVHNLFGTLMTQATADALQEADPEKRQFVLSRSSYPGMHRYAAIWTGDNHSWWEHLQLNVQQLISLNMAGFMFCGADTGGFGGDCSPDLLVRWTQLSVFSPFCRNHAAVWARAQEPWAFDSETLSLCRDALLLRQSLMPHIYGEFVRCALSHQPFIRGMFQEGAEGIHRGCESQFMCGAGLLAAPVVEPGATERRVWLPAGEWLRVQAGPKGLSAREILTTGEHIVPAGLGEIPLFVQKGSLIPMSAEPQRASGALDAAPRRYRLLGFADETASCNLLLDDGERSYGSWESWPKCRCSVARISGEWSISLVFEGTGPYQLEVECEIWDLSGAVAKVTAKS